MNSPSRGFAPGQKTDDSSIVEVDFFSIGGGGQPTKYDELFAVTFQGRKPVAHRVMGALSNGIPRVIHHAVGIMDDQEASYRCGGCRAFGAQSRVHGVKERQGNRRASPAEQRAAGKMFSGDDHAHGGESLFLATG